MTTTHPRSPHRPAPLGDADELVVVAVAGLVPFPVAAVLSLAPGTAGTVLTGLALLAVVAVAARVGGWRAGLAAAAVSGLSFDFFHAAPVHALRLDAIDLATFALLVVVGVVAGAGTPRPIHGHGHG